MRAAQGEAAALLVHLWDGSWYAMSADELSASAEAAAGETPIEQLIKPERVPVLFPDMPLDSALPHFPRWPLLPVLNRASRGTLEGIVSLKQILERYQGR